MSSNQLPLIVAIEGNIGSGKSTLLTGLAIHGFKVLQEPIDDWSTYRDEYGSLLEHMYQNPKRHSFAFQIMCLHTRTQALRDAIRECQERNIPVLIMERSLLTTYQVFTRVLMEDGLISPIESRIFRDIHQDIMGDMADLPINCVYLDTHINYCLGRIQSRQRKGEEYITVDYLTKLHNRHRQWLTMINHYHVNGDDIQENVLIDVLSYIRNLLAVRGH